MSIDKIYYYESEGYNPYINLSMEEKLMDNYEKGSLIFYLWQNQNTVVIGKNQCAADECNLALMRESNITLARRSSGGGAVFHDLGNLNFTFITGSDDYDIHKQLRVIQEALKTFGIESEFSGRNDLLVDGYKISGQAFLKKKGVSLHHGTLLVDVDLEHLGQYLKKDPTKLKKHGVQSHRQRVKNLKDFNEDLTIENIKISLKKAVEQVYQVSLFNKDLIEANVEKYSSDSWLYRLSLDGVRIKQRFDYGLLDLNLQLKDKEIVDVLINTDMMDTDLVEEIKESLIGKSFDSTLIEELKLSNKGVLNDLKGLIGDYLCMT